MKSFITILLALLMCVALVACDSSEQTPNTPETTPTETAPAPEETTPAPAETTPAPVETTPAPAETTPAETTVVYNGVKALTKINYAARARKANLNVYFIAEGDTAGNIRTQTCVPANPGCNCYSIAKAFTVTAVGMMYDRGLLTPKTLVADILGEYIPEDADPRWQEVTLHHLLTHRVGYAQSGLLDIDAQDASKFGSNDYLKLAFSAPLSHDPGKAYKYTDAAYYILSRVVAEVSGVEMSELLRPILMDTMGFKEYAWSVCPQGYAMGATGLYLRTEDVVKLGILYMRRGDWFGTRIISEKWVDIVLKNGYEFTSKGNGWYGKGGMRGQMLAFSPSRNLAVAWHSYEDSVPFNEMIHD